MNRLIIVGASGHGKVIADIAVKVGYKEIVFLDDNAAIRICADCIIGAGAVVIQDIEQPGTYIGVPAEEKNMKIRNKNAGGTAHPNNEIRASALLAA